MNFQNKLSPEKYLENKDYFDAGLIECLQARERKISDLQLTLAAYQIRHDKDQKRLTALTLKYKDLSSKLYNLKSYKKDSDAEIDDLKKEIQEIYKILNEVGNDKDDIINGLYDEIEKLKEENEELRKKQRKYKMQDSTNTNNPTSTYRFDDAEKTEVKKTNPANMREKSERKRGGQTGHKVHRKALKENTDNVINIRVKKAPAGAKPVYDENGNLLYKIIQKTNARFVTETTEYRFYIDEANGIDLHEQTMNKFRISDTVYSDNFKAQVLYLDSKGVIALDRLCTILNELSENKIDLVPGSVINWRKEFERVSKEYRDYILSTMLSSYVIHVDETGGKIDGKNSWIHIMCTSNLAYFLMTEKRADENGPLKLLESFENVLVHDHFKSYYKLNKCSHAECNAHVQRYLKGGIDYDDVPECKKLLDLLQEMLHRKHILQEAGYSEMPKDEYQEYKQRYLATIDEILKNYEKNHPEIKAKYIPNAIKTVRRMKEYQNEHLLFLRDFNVPYDNNPAERQARVCKIRKKISGQVQNLEAGEDLCAILTVIQSASLSGANTLQVITNVLQTGWPDRERLGEENIKSSN